MVERLTVDGSGGPELFRFKSSPDAPLSDTPDNHAALETERLAKETRYQESLSSIMLNELVADGSIDRAFADEMSTLPLVDRFRKIAELKAAQPKPDAPSESAARPNVGLGNKALGFLSRWFGR